MTQVFTGSHLKTYFSMAIIKTSQTPQYSKTLHPDNPQVQNRFSTEDDNDSEKLPQTKA